MTFAVSRDFGAFEWSGTSPNAIFAQRSNILRPTFWRMVFDIVRFNQFALDLLCQETPSELSIGEYLQQEGYSDAFKNDYLIPMTACVWSTGPDKCALEFPAVTLVRFLWNHHLLNTVSERPPWLTIPGGSKQYIDAVLRSCPSANIHLSTRVQSLLNGPDSQVILLLPDNKHESFDSVILACHGPQAMDIISTSATKQEKEIMSAFETTPNVAYLHSDTSLMPQRHLTWSSWNYLTTTSPDPSPPTPFLSNGTTKPAPAQATASPGPKVTLTYNMNILQHLSAPSPAPPGHSHPVSPSSPHILVTLNPPPSHLPAKSLTQAVIPYAHPLYNAAAVQAQARLPSIQGTRGIYYAGAWTGYGFHEDGLRSGIEVATRPELGGSVEWDVVDAREMRGRRPSFGWRDHAVRIVVLMLLVVLRVGERVFAVLGGFERKSEDRRASAVNKAKGLKGQ